MPELPERAPELAEVEITLLLQQHRAGDEAALHQLMPFVYAELKRLARLNLNAGQPSWQPTMLAHEVFLYLFDGQLPHWNDRAHFFNTISRQMRHLLIDAARRKQALKRGGKQLLLPLNEATLAAVPATPRVELLQLDAALRELERDYPRPAKVVELRYFVGLDEAETAQALGVTARTVRRDWAFAKSWLLEYLQPKAGQR